MLAIAPTEHGASASLVDLPCIGLDGRTLTSSLSDRSRPLCTVELRRDVGAPAMTRTPIARLEDGSLSCWQTEAIGHESGSRTRLWGFADLSLAVWLSRDGTR